MNSKFPETSRSPKPLRHAFVSGSSLVRTTAFAASLLLLGGAVSQAQTVWDWQVTSGTWSNGANWDEGTSPTNNAISGDSVNLTNGTSLSAATTTVNTNGNGYNLTIGEFNTLLFNGSGLFIRESFTNDGTVQFAINFELNMSQAGDIVNTGTFEFVSGTARLRVDSNTLLNSGGLVTVKDGATFETSNFIIDGGTLQVEQGGAYNVALDKAGPTSQFDNIAINNEGTISVNQNSTQTSGNWTRLARLGSGTVFTNTANATTEVVNQVVSAGATGLDAQMLVDTGASFQNAGTLTVRSNGSDNDITSQKALFTVAAGATGFTNTGTVEVSSTSTETGTLAEFSSAQSITNEGFVHIKGNAFSENASFSVTGAGNDYTQSGDGTERTLLEQGGALNATDAIDILAGTLGGVGTVTAANTTIGGSASLIVAETLAGDAEDGILTFDGDLTLGNNSTVEFGLDSSSATSGQIAFVGDSNLNLGTGMSIVLNDLTGGNWIDGTVYELFLFGTGSFSGDLGEFSVSAPSGWTASLSDDGVDSIDLTLSIVPEPSTYAFLVGSFFLAVAMIRRRRLRS